MTRASHVIDRSGENIFVAGSGPGRPQADGTP
jgi:hypothetical protein